MSHTPDAGGVVHRGLAGIYFDTTAISRIDGVAGVLEYRGLRIEDVAAMDLVAVTFLLVEGRLPTAEDRSLARSVAEGELQKKDGKPLETTSQGSRNLARSVIQTFGPSDLPSSPGELSALHAIRISARIARGLGGALPTHAADEFRASALDAFSATSQRTTRAEALRKAIVLLAEHGANASTFVARVVTSAGASAQAGLVAACCALEGRIHGGAIEACMSVLGTTLRAESPLVWLAGQRAAGRAIPGFGHRVYRTEDPRVAILRCCAVEAAGGTSHAVGAADALRDGMLSAKRFGLAANVDLYGAALLLELGLPPDLGVEFFALARSIGWCAHIREQANNNILIRPLLLPVASNRDAR